MIPRPPTSTPLYSSAASEVYKRLVVVAKPPANARAFGGGAGPPPHGGRGGHGPHRRRWPRGGRRRRRRRRRARSCAAASSTAKTRTSPRSVGTNGDLACNTNDSAQAEYREPSPKARIARHTLLAPQYMRLAMGSSHSVHILISINLTVLGSYLLTSRRTWSDALARLAAADDAPPLPTADH